mmetsp:Transcript_14324/g.35684  ORF Transcript_14324/g.35684 Transcript_14324/m.35684 type:complete len:267 (-) Transcript_14324:2697-3497(-)
MPACCRSASCLPRKPSSTRMLEILPFAAYACSRCSFNRASDSRKRSSAAASFSRPSRTSAFSAAISFSDDSITQVSLSRTSSRSSSSWDEVSFAAFSSAFCASHLARNVANAPLDCSCCCAISWSRTAACSCSAAEICWSFAATCSRSPRMLSTNSATSVSCCFRISCNRALSLSRTLSSSTRLLFPNSLSSCFFWLSSSLPCRSFSSVITPSDFSRMFPTSRFCFSISPSFSAMRSRFVLSISAFSEVICSVSSLLSPSPSFFTR